MFGRLYPKPLSFNRIGQISIQERFQYSFYRKKTRKYSIFI